MNAIGFDFLTTREVASYLRLFKIDPETGEPDNSRPDLNKVHGLAHRNPSFPRPKKMGRHNRYSIAEVKAWLESQARGGPSAPPASPAEESPKRRGPKPKAVK